MMTIEDIKAMIAAYESRTLELKKSTGELKDGMHAACAFLNTEGGWLIFGIFPPQIPIESVKDSHESYPYNRNMAQALYRSTFLESWGSGIHRIIEACREQGVEDPTWRWDGGFVYVTFKRPTYNQGKLGKESQINVGGNVAPNPENVALNTENVALNVVPNKDDVALSLDERILQIIKSNPSIRREDIAAQLSVNKKTVERHLKDLGVKWEGHSKTGNWIVEN